MGRAARLPRASRAGAVMTLTDVERTLLARIADRDGTDLLRTTGRTPVPTARLLAGLQPFVERGLVAIDRSTMPTLAVPGGRIALGAGWVRLTRAGRAALAGDRVAAHRTPRARL